MKNDATNPSAASGQIPGARRRDPNYRPPMKPGKIFTRGGHQYRFIEEVPYWTRNGERFMVLMRIEGTCAECGGKYKSDYTKSAVRKGRLSRRCKYHHAPGTPAPPPKKKIAKKSPARPVRSKPASTFQRGGTITKLVPNSPPPKPTRQPSFLD